MIDNLVENAIKYSPAQGEVVVELESSDDFAVLTVTDEGPGIPPALHSRVFDRFYRGPEQAQAGSGLGLAIVKAAVLRHQGTVALEAGGSGHGLRVVVRLPRAVDGSAPGHLPRPTEPLSP